MVPQRKTPQGRVITMKVVGDRGSKNISGEQLRSLLDLRSTLIDASVSNGNVYIYGKGFGHGVGLSQWGANELAQEGINYQAILGHYYQNTNIAKLATN
jgi:stage II sporulation protein D